MLIKKYTVQPFILLAFVLSGLIPQGAKGDEIPLSILSSSEWAGIVDVAVDGNYAYCAAAYGLVILDISNPSSPQFVSRLYIPDGTGRAIAKVPGIDYVYLALGYRDWHGGLHIIDVSDPENPGLTSTYPTWYICDVELRFDDTKKYAFIADDYSGSQIIDVTDPYNPNMVSIFNPSSTQFMGLSVSGDYVYLAAVNKGVIIVDISNIHSPIQVRQVETSWRPMDVEVFGDYLYVANGSHGGLYVIDISDPNQADTIASRETPRDANRINVDNAHAYLSTHDTLLIYDVSDPFNPTEITRLNVPAYSVEIVGDNLFIPELFNLHIADITTPESPQTIGIYDASINSQQSVIYGDYAYVASCQFGLQIFDISNKANINMVGSLPTRFCACAVDVAGNYAYIADDDSGMQVINVTDPYNPVEASYLKAPYSIFDLEYKDGYIFAASYEFGMYVIDVSDPYQPELSVEFQLYEQGVNTNFGDISIDGNFAYLSGYVRGLYIVDITQPENPVLAARYCSGSSITYGVHAENDLAYIIKDYNISIVDVSDLSHMTEIGAFGSAGLTRHLAKINRYLALASNEGGMQIVNVADPTNPYSAGYYHTFMAHGISVTDGYAFLCDEHAFFVFNMWGEYIAGDANFDHKVNISDAILIINYIFGGGDSPLPMQAGDTNCDGTCNVSDAVWIISYIFAGGNQPNDLNGDKIPDC